VANDFSGDATAILDYGAGKNNSQPDSGERWVWET
jgi:hypothetical protein